MKFGFANVFFTLEIRVQPERVKEIYSHPETLTYDEVKDSLK